LLLLFGQLLVPLFNLPIPFGEPVEGQGELLPRRGVLRTCRSAGACPNVCLRIIHAPWNHKSIPKGTHSSGKTTKRPGIPCQADSNSRKDAPITATAAMR